MLRGEKVMLDSDLAELYGVETSHADLAQKLEAMEKKYDSSFRVVFDAIRKLMAEKSKPKREIGFHTLMPKPAKVDGARAKRI